MHGIGNSTAHNVLALGIFCHLWPACMCPQDRAVSSSIVQHHQDAETSLSQARIDPTVTHSGPSRDASAFSLSTLHVWVCTLLTGLGGGDSAKDFHWGENKTATRDKGNQNCWKIAMYGSQSVEDDVHPTVSRT